MHIIDYGGIIYYYLSSEKQKQLVVIDNYSQH